MATVRGLAVAGAAASLWRLGKRSGVTAADVLAPLPADDIIELPAYVADRATVVDAPVDEVWPWIVQLGRQRAGWYAPAWLERLLVRDRARRGSRRVQPELQHLAAGDVVADWGPGSLKVLRIEPPRLLVYASVTGPADEDYLFSWVHQLRALPTGGTQVYTRLRIRRSSRRMLNPLMSFMGIFDYLTMVVMYAGLRERVRPGPGSR